MVLRLLGGGGRSTGAGEVQGISSCRVLGVGTPSVLFFTLRFLGGGVRPECRGKDGVSSSWALAAPVMAATSLSASSSEMSSYTGAVLEASLELGENRGVGLGENWCLPWLLSLLCFSAVETKAVRTL